MVTFSARALAALERIDKWWRTQRPEAASLFGDELKATMSRVELLPNTGQLYRRGKREIRRVLLPKSRNHIYYHSNSAGIHVYEIWSATSPRPPRL